MTTFDDRERAQEAKFAYDAELNFKAEARRKALVDVDNDSNIDTIH